MKPTTPSTNSMKEQINNLDSNSNTGNASDDKEQPKFINTTTNNILTTPIKKIPPPHKYLLFRPTLGNLMVTLATAYKVSLAYSIFLKKYSLSIKINFRICLNLQFYYYIYHPILPLLSLMNSNIIHLYPILVEFLLPIVNL